MSYTSSDKPLLVAPRPVRVNRNQLTRFVSAPAEYYERTKLVTDSELDEMKVGKHPDISSASDKDTDTRASPRSSLPSEALEEFLAILRPAFFPPSSPTLRPRLQGSTSLPTFSYRARPRLELLHDSSKLSAVEELEKESPSRQGRSSSSATPDNADHPAEHNRMDMDSLPVRWLQANAHASPISRLQTRNPFQRHPSYEPTAPHYSPMNTSPLSPAAVPLPLPTPDEMIQVS